MQTHHPHRSTTHEERFIHIKEPLHLNGKDYKGATVFFRYEKQSDDQERETLMAAISYCSHNDNWCRRIGRNVARRHYFLGKRRIIDGNGDFYELARQMYTGVTL